MSYVEIIKSQGLLKVQDLIQKFTSNYASYSRSTYNETQTRTDFIDPFFEALNWDLKNNRNLSDSLREVILEDSTENDSTNQKPDYGFRAGNTKKFFVEAKKPHVKIETHKNSAFQARSYGWTDKHPIVVLTNFEYLVIYDTSVKPNAADDGKICRTKIYHYKEYDKKFDEIYELLSRDSVFSGKFDKQTLKIKSSLPIISPDEYFLEQINKWRKLFAHNIIKKDPKLNGEEINDLVQQLINRIIFLRICEDRTIEPSENLLNSIKSLDKQKFISILEKSTQKYNSELFKSANLPIEFDSDNKELAEVIHELYYPQSPFSFRVIESSLLGEVYEMFLTKKLKINSGSVITLEKKPEEKNRDVVSTPSFIINNIVTDAVGTYCKNMTPTEIHKIRILDPACGSGSFLVNAFQFLIDYVIDWYVKNGDDGEIYPVVGGYRLSLKEKIKLLNCIFGVDVDYNAVEVTQFSLCVKLLEDETKTTIKQMEKILPKLSQNILWGNSVVDSDIWQVIPKDTLKQFQLKKINVFDWKEKFDGISFNVIIGNPPYMKTEDMKEYIHPQWEFFKEYYSTSYKQFDLYYIFIQKCFGLLSKKGQMGFIVPHKFMKISSGEKLREFLSVNNSIRKIIDFGTQQIFKNKTTYSCLLFLENKI